MSSKTKEKTKKKEKEKEKGKENRKAATLCLETRARSKGYMAKALKLGALSQLVGSHQLSARYMGGWVRFSEL